MAGAKVRVDNQMELAEAAAYLQSVIADLRAGRLNVHEGKHAVTLAPQGPVHVRVKARRKNERETISLRITWDAQPEFDDDFANVPNHEPVAV